MKNPISPLEGHLQVVRNLTVSAFSMLNSGGKLRNELLSLNINSSDFNQLNSSVYKAKDRFNSFRVLLQTKDAAKFNDAANALAESFLSYVQLIHEATMEMNIPKAAEPYRIKCQSVIDSLFTNENYFESVHDDNTIKNTSRLPSKFPSDVPKFVTLFFCVEVGIRFAKNISVSKKAGISEIIREIRFPPEFQQAGLSILNYFATVLNDKYPNIPVTVSIQQRQSSVTLVITHPDGTQDIISRALTDYGLVVTGQMSPNEFVKDDFRAMALQQKLELAQLEVRQVRDLLRLQDQYSSKRIESLESEVKNLHRIIDREFTSREKLQDGLLALSAQFTKGHVSEHMTNLISSLSQAIAERNSERTKVLLEDIQSSQPTIFSRLNDFFVQAVSSGIIGNYAYDWLKTLWPILPK